MKQKICGIYKITSPSGKVYVGQSVDFNSRYIYYRNIKKSCKQRKLYNSFKKYGVKNHIFEIIEQCEASLLNDRERHYQDLFDVCGANGLNCRLTKSADKSGCLSKETVRRLSVSHLGQKSWCTGLKITYSEEGARKRREARKRFVYTESHKDRLRVCMIGNTKSINKIVLDTQTGIFYDNGRYASEACGINYHTLRARLNGTIKNNTSFIYA